MRTPQEWSQNISGAPWCLAAVFYKYCCSSRFADEIPVKLKKFKAHVKTILHWDAFCHFRWFMTLVLIFVINLVLIIYLMWKNGVKSHNCWLTLTHHDWGRQLYGWNLDTTAPSANHRCTDSDLEWCHQRKMAAPVSDILASFCTVDTNCPSLVTVYSPHPSCHPWMEPKIKALHRWTPKQSDLQTACDQRCTVCSF